MYEPGAAKRRQGHALRGGEDRRSRTRPAAELALHSAEARAGHSSSRQWGNDILTAPWTHPVQVDLSGLVLYGTLCAMWI